MNEKISSIPDQSKKTQNADLSGKRNSSFFKPFIQPKLTINQPDDQYEQEADAVADKVMRMTDHEAVPTSFFKPAVTVINRMCVQCKEEEEEEKGVQRKETNADEITADKNLESYLGNLNAGGQKLPDEVRQFYEPRMGHSFDNVKVHTDTAAHASAYNINALAYTHGSNIVFGANQFNPESESGKKLLAHELTHVVQQGKATDKTIQRRTARSEYATAAYLPGPIWNVVLIITGAPEGESESFLDFENACMDGIRGAAGALGNGRTALRRTMTVRMRYRRRFDFVTIENEAYQQALHSVLPPPAPVAPAAPAVVPPTPAVVAPAPVVTTSRAGADFDQFIARIDLLEAAAIADGYSLTQRITAFRKIYYNSGGPAQTYAGSAVGGGAFNILIPGAASTQLPPSWLSQQNLIDAQAYFVAHPEVRVDPWGSVDMGHLFAGMDAGQHPASVSIALGSVRFRSNKEAATFIGDLGSVVVEYINANPASFRDVAMSRNNTILNAQYTNWASDADMAGNADSYALTLNAARSISQNLIDYYTPASGGVNRRYTSFAASIGLGTLTGGTFSGNSSALRSALTGEVFNGALAYAAANGRRIDVTNVFADPGPGIFVPTFWEMYFNISGWVVEKFIQTLAVKVAAE